MPSLSSLLARPLPLAHCFSRMQNQREVLSVNYLLYSFVTYDISAFLHKNGHFYDF